MQNDSETVGDKWNLWSTKNRIAAIEKKTFFEKIASLDQSFSWKLYYHQSTEIYNGFIPCMSQAFGLSSPQNQVQFEELALDASDPKRTLPSFSFIEPRYEPVNETNKHKQTKLYLILVFLLANLEYKQKKCSSFP